MGALGSNVYSVVHDFWCVWSGVGEGMELDVMAMGRCCFKYNDDDPDIRKDLHEDKIISNTYKCDKF